MTRLYIFFLSVLPFLAFAQGGNKRTVISLTTDSLVYSLERNWLYLEGDSAVFAAKDYNDTGWKVTNPYRRVGDANAEQYSKPGWFRLHIVVDSSIAGKTLALSMTQLGASEIYLNGKRINSFGRIKGKDSTVNQDPQNTPVVITFPDTGEHVLAVRYVNYDAAKNFRKYNKSFSGFKMKMGEAEDLIVGHHSQMIAISIVFLLMAGIFFAMGILHMFLYFYYRAERSNLYFSLFCISISALFFLPYIMKIANTPSIQLKAGQFCLYFGAAACIALSGLSNSLFGKMKLRFKIIAALCMLAVVLLRVELAAGIITYVVAIAAVMIEAVALTISAIYRKVKGARIIGTGILFFTLFILTVISVTLINGDFSIDEGTLMGQIIELIMACAILSIPVSMSGYLAWNFASVNKGLKVQLEQVRLLSEKTLQQELEKQHMLETRKEELEREVSQRTEEVTLQKQEIEKQHEELKNEKKKTDDLLLNILPEEIAEELKQKGSSGARHFDHVSVLFTDFVNFTKAGERMSPQELVDELDTCFKMFDSIISKYGIEKIKTIGDAYMAVCGLPTADSEHATKVATAAVEIRQYIAERRKQMGDKAFEIRIGIHSGSVVAGIVGVKKFAYDIWGDTVNTAARMEQNSEPGKINISQTSYELVKDSFNCHYRGEIDAKNKGALKMYFLE
jgi:adenylate cyclase